MKCSNCGTENPQGAKFCGQCGTPLPRICPQCQKEIAPEHQFCLSCGTALHCSTPPLIIQDARWKYLAIGVCITALIVLLVSGGYLWWSRHQSLKRLAQPGQTGSTSLLSEETIKGLEEKEQKEQCASNLKQLATAMAAYRADYDGRFPLAQGWAEGLLPYHKGSEIYKCPSRPHDKVGYAFNANLSGVNEEDVQRPSETIELFESNAARQLTAVGFERLPSPADTGESWIEPGVHEGGNWVAFVDGHVKWFWEKPVRNNYWEPWAEYLNEELEEE